MHQAQPISVQASLSNLLTKAEVATRLRRSPSGVDKLRLRDPSFPKPIKDGIDRRSRVYFIATEIEVWLNAKIEARVA